MTAAENDLTAALIQMKTGLKRDVQSFISQMEQGVLFVPLAKGVQNQAGGLDQQESISSHMLVHPNGSYYAALFTQAPFLRPLESELGWKTDGGPLDALQLPARIALVYAMKLLARDNVAGLLLNPYHESGLELQAYEVESMVTGQALPLVAYVPATPLQPEERIHVMRPQADIPATMMAALSAFHQAHPEVSHYEIADVFNEQRDLQPNLTVNLHTAVAPPKYAPLAHELLERLQGNLPEPGYIDILFNEQFPAFF